MDDHDNNRVSVFLCGCGTVGLHTLKMIEELRLPFDVKGVFVRDVGKNRPGLKKHYPFTSALEDVLQSDAEMIVEVIGGTSTAQTIIDDAMKKDKIVVTANKALLAEHPEYLRYPKMKFEASVAGGIPIIRTLKECTMPPISRISAVLNGTCNYILYQMTSEGLTYVDALRLAQDMGFAEADPEFDVEGKDAFQKLSILSHMVFDLQIHGEQSIRRGISNVCPVDVAYAREMGCVIRHVCQLGISDVENPILRARCMPTVLRADHDLVVDRANNAAIVEADGLRLVLKGPGAGGVPTANSVVTDMLSSPSSSSHVGPRSPDFIVGATGGKFFLRFTVMDELGIVATISTLCRDLSINIDSIIQHPESGPKLNFVLTTGWTTLMNMDALISNIIARHHWYRSSFLAVLWP